MIDYISISTLNDFIFCPYSIYLHNVYVENKIRNQIKALSDTRKKDEITLQAKATLEACIDTLPDVVDYESLMGIEGTAAKNYFKTFLSGPRMATTTTKDKM